MPLIHSSFQTPWWLRNGHLQTVLGGLWRPRIEVAFRRERLELEDGDFLDLDRVDGGSDRTVVISHGLEGSSDDACVRGTAAAFLEMGWNVVAWNYRGCGGEPNRLPRAYHSGDAADLAAVIERVTAGSVALIGFSLGGNLVLKYLGEEDVHPRVFGAVAVSAPVDLASSARALDEKLLNRIYRHRLIGRLLTKVREKAARFPDCPAFLDRSGVHGFAAFDGRFTAPMHGFASALDYWSRCSARPLLRKIQVPTLLVNALDDPFLAAECFPFAEARESDVFHLETPARGGHLGFLDGFSRASWMERRARDFLTSLPKYSHSLKSSKKRIKIDI